MERRLEFETESENEAGRGVESAVGSDSVNVSQPQKGLYIVGLPLQLPEAERSRFPEYYGIKKIGGSHASTGLEAVSHLLFRQLSGKESLAKQVMAALNRTSGGNAGKYAFKYELPEFVFEGKGKPTPREIEIQRNMYLALKIAKHLGIDMNSGIEPRKYGFNQAIDQINKELR